MPELSEASRPIMWNISEVWVLYLMFFAGMGVFCFGIYKRIAHWKEGRADDERLGDFGRRLWILVKELAHQKKVRDSKFPGFFHSFVFYSFVVLILTTAVVAVDYDFGLSIFKGHPYAFLTVAAEAAGVFILIGIAMAAWRRLLLKPKTVETRTSDTWPLLLIGGIVLTGFLVEGLRIRAMGDDWALLSPVGLGIAAAFGGISKSSAEALHATMWWFHVALSIGWIATIPYTKFFHLVALPTNVFFAKLKPRGELSRVNIIELMESDDLDDDAFEVGIERADQFTWKQRLDFDACISCGRCEEVCPAFDIGNPFSPKMFLAKCRDQIDAAHDNDDESDDKGKPLVGNAFDEDFIWYCRTCTACMEVCPACVEHVDTLIELRRSEVLVNGRLPDEARRALKQLETNGNPFGPQSDREEWVDSLGVRVVGPNERCDVLYWAGCCTAFDPSKQKIAKDVCTLLDECGIDFGVLGKDELCCGDPARVLGDERLFQEKAAEQVAELNSRDFQVLLTSCPHCYNVLKNEYPQFGGNYNVVHHSEFLHEMLWAGRLTPRIGAVKRAIYHDPCYLGRYQHIYDSPREVLKAITGADVMEMKNSKEASYCCGGGGGHFWMDLKKGERINNLRVKQAKEAGAETIVTGCAYCKQMLEDAVKSLDLDEQMSVVDLASMVAANHRQIPEVEGSADESSDAGTDSLKTGAIGA